jgi:O-antigen biosynthesis protein
MLQTLHPTSHHPVPVVFYIFALGYSYMHSGVRCLHLLCHHLNRLGYRAYIGLHGRQVTNASLNTPAGDLDLLERFRREGLADIVIYPEVTQGNPLDAQRVVRYLLNRPGFFTGVGVEGYGADDFFIHFADEFLPAGLKSRKLRLPLVDQEVYRPPERPVARAGFAVYADRYQPDTASFPAWITNYDIVSRAAPRDPQSLASLYQRSRALISGERTSALNEAIHCGCPVIVIPNPTFDHAPVLDFYDGDGFAVGFDQAALERATLTVARAQETYRTQFRGLDSAVHAFVERACKHFGL